MTDLKDFTEGDLAQEEELFLGDAEVDELAGYLTSLLAKPKKEITTEEEEAALDITVGFDDLDSLLADSMTNISKKAEVTRARKALHRGNVIGEERAKLQAIVAKWELEKEWNVVGADALFEVQQCKCGNVQHHFLGFFQKQEHRTSKITRWLAAVDGVRTLEDLTKGIKEELFEVPVCIKCAVKQGWGVAV